MDGIRAAQDRLLSRRFGIFNHFLSGEPGNEAASAYTRGAEDWNRRIAAFDVPALARRVRETGAGYYFITIQQSARYMIAPNAAYDRIGGIRPGEACPERDLIMDIADELAKYDIDMCLYIASCGPYDDAELAPKFGFGENMPLNRAYVEKWAEVIREYSLRYGEKIKAWWIDGCYREVHGFTDELMALLDEACKAGNPHALVAQNDGVKQDFEKNYVGENLICGEFNDFERIPDSRFIDGAQAHILAPLGKGVEGNEWSRWRSRGAQRDGSYMADYIRRANEAGMPVTIDAFIDGDGNWDEEQFEVLKEAGRRLQSGGASF